VVSVEGAMVTHVRPLDCHVMSGGPTGWFPLIFTTVAAGGVGSVIATYGGQARERRNARSGVIACLQRLEVARKTHKSAEVFDYDTAMAELSAQCVLANVPRYLMDLYELANDAPKYSRPRQRPLSPPAEKFPDRDVEAATVLVADEAARLLGSAVWHPWLSGFFRRRKARDIRELTIALFPSASPSPPQIKEMARRAAAWQRSRGELRAHRERDRSDER
jgi:hypothetical protein